MYNYGATNGTNYRYGFTSECIYNALNTDSTTAYVLNVIANKAYTDKAAFTNSVVFTNTSQWGSTGEENDPTFIPADNRSLIIALPHYAKAFYMNHANEISENDTANEVKYGKTDVADVDTIEPKYDPFYTYLNDENNPGVRLESIKIFKYRDAEESES